MIFPPPKLSQPCAGHTLRMIFLLVLLVLAAEVLTHPVTVAALALLVAWALFVVLRVARPASR